MSKLSLLLPLLAAVPIANAQDSIWQANRWSLDLHQVRPCGEVANVIDLTGNGFNLRSVHEAPDGKLWVVNYIQPTLTIIDAAGTITNIPAALGSPFDLAFDKAGHAWVSGGTGVEEFDASGFSVGTYPLADSAPLGISIDGAGNKWIAHRSAQPGSLSRIDGATGAITNHPSTPNSQILPTQVVADFRGIGNPSHIWIIGDNRGSGDLVEFDSNGNFLALYQIDLAGRFASITSDAVGNLWINDFGNGNVHQVDQNTGMVLNTFLDAPTSIGVAIDGFGRLFTTNRVSFSGPVPSEVRRYDSTGVLEVPAVVGLGSGSDASTRHHYAMVVDPNGDLDGDGDRNILEVSFGTSPNDACSNSFTSINSTGVSKIGSTVQIDVQTAGGTALVFGLGALYPGRVIPGIKCEFNIRNPLPFTVPVVGTSVPVSIPLDPTLDGLNLQVQGLTISGAGAQFTNLTCIHVWM